MSTTSKIAWYGLASIAIVVILFFLLFPGFYDGYYIVLVEVDPPNITEEIKYERCLLPEGEELKYNWDFAMRASEEQGKYRISSKYGGMYAVLWKSYEQEEGVTLRCKTKNGQISFIRHKYPDFRDNKHYRFTINLRRP